MKSIGSIAQAIDDMSMHDFALFVVRGIVPPELEAAAAKESAKHADRPKYEPRPPSRESLGTVVWWFGGRIVGQASVYVGETIDDYAVKQRAFTCLDQMTKNYFHHGVPKFYPLGT